MARIHIFMSSFFSFSVSGTEGSRMLDHSPYTHSGFDYVYLYFNVTSVYVFFSPTTVKLLDTTPLMDPFIQFLPKGFLCYCLDSRSITLTVHSSDSPSSPVPFTSLSFSRHTALSLFPRPPGPRSIPTFPSSSDNIDNP